MDDAVLRVKEKVDIAEYIGRSVQLKKTGRNFTGLCPFHLEKSPSFNVSPERGVFKCFGCGVSGDLFSFVMQRDGLNFQEALKMLAQEAGVDLEERSSSGRKLQRSQEERYLEMHELATEYYHFLLAKHEVGQEAREYLEKRGLVLEKADGMLEKFKIGYAPRSWDAIGNYLVKKGYKPEEIIACGLGVKSENIRGFYDMFRGRVMFPLYDKSGRVVGFAGRVLGNEKTAKYINTAETPIFHKRDFLFGYFQAKDFIRRKGEVVLVEGEMDMLSSYKVGVKNVVAVKGSVLTEEQIELLGRLCNKLLLCFDADFAGDKAMRKAIELAESKGMEIKVVQLSAGKDPDECIKKGVQLWIDSVTNAVPFYDFLIQSGLKRHNVIEPFGKRDFLNELFPHISSIKDLIVRSHYLQRMSILVDMPEKQIEQFMRSNSQVAQFKPGFHKPDVQTVSKLVIKRVERPDERTSLFNKVHRLEWYVLALLLRMKEPIVGLDKKLAVEDIDDKKVRLVYNLYIDFFATRPDNYIDDFLQSVHGEDVLPVIDDIFLIDVAFESDNELSNELFTTAKTIKELALKEKIRLVSLEMKKSEISGTSDIDIEGLQKEIFSLHERLGRLHRVE